MKKIASRILIVLILMVSVVLTIQIANNLLASEFDVFAKRTIRELGHNASGPAASAAIREYLEDRDIDDPIAYFKQHMENTGVLDSSDRNLRDTDKGWLRGGEVKRITFFKKRYFNRIITSYDLHVYVWDLPSGERKVSATIDLNAP